MAETPGTDSTYMICGICNGSVRFDQWVEHLRRHSTPAPKQREEREALPHGPLLDILVRLRQRLIGVLSAEDEIHELLARTHSPEEPVEKCPRCDGSIGCMACGWQPLNSKEE